MQAHRRDGGRVCLFGGFGGTPPIRAALTTGVSPATNSGRDASTAFT
jgi:hypothetical protein